MIGVYIDTSRGADNWLPVICFYMRVLTYLMVRD